MYLKHFRLKCMPFEIGPDPKFLWLGSKHQEAFAILRYGILESKGFIVITGEPGTGKSTLLNATIAAFDQSVRFAKVSDPALDAMDFFNFAADAFGMGRAFRSKGEFLIQLKRFIREAGSRKLILVIDEAQRITREVLEHIRVFSDTEAPGQHVFSCILAGQPEFLEMVAQNQALSQRIFFSHTLQPLTREETADYIAHRLKIAGRQEPLFTPAAVIDIYRLSGGNPRLVNVLCDQALLTAYGSNKTQIGPEIIREGTESTLIRLQTAIPAAPAPLAPTPPVPAAKPASDGIGKVAAPPEAEVRAASGRGHKRAYLTAIAAVLVLTLAVFFYRSGGFQRGATLPRNAPESAGIVDSGAGLQRQIADLQREKDAAETQLRDLQARGAELETERKELPNLRQRLSEAEMALSQRDATIAELRRRLELSGSEQSAGSKQVEALPKEKSQLQAKLADDQNQRSALEAKLTEEQKQTAGLTAKATALKGALERVTELEATLSERDKKLARLEQAASELEREKGSRAQINTELAARQAAVADLQIKLDAARSLQLKLEADIQNVKSDNARLQAQVQELRGKPQPAQAPVITAPQAVAPTAPAAYRQPEGPDPMGVIDYVIKRKPQ